MPTVNARLRGERNGPRSGNRCVIAASAAAENRASRTVRTKSRISFGQFVFAEKLEVIPTIHAFRVRLALQLLHKIQIAPVLIVDLKELRLKDRGQLEVNADLHGNAPDKSDVALLIIDVINDLEFEGGDQLLQHALPMAQQIQKLKERARAARVPVVYVNDNFGKWRSNFSAQVQHCLDGAARGRPVVELLQPDQDDYFVLKAKHSGFFSTSLDILLQYLGCRTLVLTGMAAEVCVLFTANDAYMRDFRLVVPNDCVASIRAESTRYALEQMQQVLKAATPRASEVEFPDNRNSD